MSIIESRPNLIGQQQSKIEKGGRGKWRVKNGGWREEKVRTGLLHRVSKSACVDNTGKLFDSSQGRGEGKSTNDFLQVRFGYMGVKCTRFEQAFEGRINFAFKMV